jgi:hypothetical protein
MRDRDRRLAGGRDPIDVGGLQAGIEHRIERRVGVQLASGFRVSRSRPFTPRKAASMAREQVGMRFRYAMRWPRRRDR